MTTRELLHNHDRGQIENWVRARARSAYVGDAILCRVLGNHNLYADPLNYDMAPWLMLDGLWEMWIAMAIGRAIQPGWHCIDAGAWCGFYSVLFGSLCGPAGRVLAYEPNRRHAELCRRSLRSNGFSNAEVRAAAIGARPQDQASYLLTDGGGSRLDATGGAVVPVETIDGAGMGRVDLIKMDIEGGEVQAWEGMQETIRQNPNIIIVMEVCGARCNAPEFYGKLQQVFPKLRTITTDGLVTVISLEDLIRASATTEQMVWLQN